jgi:hypothetical protein
MPVMSQLRAAQVERDRLERRVVALRRDLFTAAISHDRERCSDLRRDYNEATAAFRAASYKVSALQPAPLVNRAMPPSIWRRAFDV